ncbi:kinase-like domain-containing protein [Syncephalis fuscata]|nr:kinase-like domain-containing protein [Syncephalis fuscata]
MNLYQYIVKRQQNERHRVMRNVFYQLIRAVAFLHFAGVTHNDIKPENIRVYIDKHRTLQITLVNYALALPIQLKRPSNSIVLMAPPGGTVGYDSPESIVFGNTNLVQRDTWAVGMTAYTCFMGMPLYGYVSIDRETHQMPSRDYQKQLITCIRTI